MGTTNGIVFVYILRLSGNKHYTGITNNPVKRFKEHINGKSKFTSHFQIDALIYIEQFPSRKAARIKEVYIKQTGAMRYILKSKFQDRCYLDIDINELTYLSNDESALNQLKIIISKYIYF